MRVISEDVLGLNPDGSVFHLRLQPEQLAEKIVMMGDPGRVPVVSSHFERIEFDQQNREFRVCTGYYKGKRITALSHGIGCDNIDIVLNELDALTNINLQTRTVNDQLRSLTMVRIGTSGGIVPACPVGSYVVSEISMGMDGLLYFYKNGVQITEPAITEAFLKAVKWEKKTAIPYFVRSDKKLVEKIGYDMIKGITCSASGFYGPQGRYLRLPLTNPDQNKQLETFSFEGLQMTNYEMESAAVAGLSALMGHQAVTVCMIIFNRHTQEANTDYKHSFDDLILKVLDRI
jgi:Uridine phosphorylase